MEGSERLDCFERFVRSHERALYGQAYLICGRRHEAEDLVQETFVQAWRHWDRVSSYDEPAAWARRVLHNLAVSRWRRFRHPVGRPEALRDVPARFADEPDVGHLDVLAALSRLPVRQRIAVVLYVINDLSVAEVAAEMNAPAGSVRGWLSRARTALASDLGLDLDLEPRRDERVVGDDRRR